MMAKRFITRCSAVLIALASGTSVACEYNYRGKEIQGGLIVVTAQPGAKAVVDGKAVRVSPEGVFLVGFGRDRTKAANVQITCADGNRASHDFRPESREYNIQRITGVPSNTVTPSAESLKRIRRENALIGKARRVDDPRTNFLEDFIWPVHGTVTGVYGSQRYYNGEPRRPHYGVDVAAPLGTPVVAPSDGVITLAHPDMFYSGGTVILDHGHGLSSAFLHMDTVTVKDGQRIRQGDQIGTVGAKGRATGPHLDWRMNLFKQRLDVQLFMPTSPEIK